MFLAPLVAVVFSGLIVGCSSMDSHANHASSTYATSHASHADMPTTKSEASNTDKGAEFSIRDYMPPVLIYKLFKKMQS